MNKVYKIDHFLLDSQTRQFFNKKEPINLSSRAFDILLYLVENRGKVIEKDELMQAIWADSFVEESNLAVQISGLRRVLGEKKGESKFIKTVSGRGYSFVASMQEVENEIPSSAVTLKASSRPVLKAATSSETVSLAVLPFTADNNDPDFEYLASGITQTLISNLSQIATLKVMAYSAVAAYKASETDLQEIGFLLGVDKLLLGRISAYKDNLDIGIELIDANDKSFIWGTEYNCKFTDVFQVKKEISFAIAEQLKLQLSKSDEANLSKQQTTNTDAFKLYLKGKYILEKISTRKENLESLHQALNLFQEALKIDPNFALAYTGIGMSYNALYNHNFLSRDKAQTNSDRVFQLALNLDKNLSEAYVVKGLNSLYYERDVRQAEQALNKAITLNPNNAMAYHWLALTNACLKKFPEAISHQNQALHFDPLSIYFNNGLSKIFYFSENYNKAIIQAEETLTLDSRSMVAYYFLALIYAQLGMYQEAIINAEKAYGVNSLQEAYLLVGYVRALSGDKKEAVKIAEQVLAKSAEQQIDFVDVAAIYAALGETEKALNLLKKSADGEGTNILVLAVDPRFKSLRENPKFVNILQDLKLIDS